MEWRHIEAARRVLASETGAIVRDWGGQVPVALVYPNAYSVGMSSLAMHGLYRWLGNLPGVVCERAFAWLNRRPSPDDPVVTLESQRPIQDLAAVGFSVSFEMDYFNIVAILGRAKIPLKAQERTQEDPLVILGGPAVSANPLPMAPLADAIIIGEVEPILSSLGECLRDVWSQDRASTLQQLANLPGVYVPLVHDGETISRLWLHDLDEYPTYSSVVAPLAEFGDMHLIEISRGCGRGCRFCLAGYWYRPPREHSLANVLAQAREGMQQRNKVGLVAAAVSDYSEIEPLVHALRRQGTAISVSSLRVNPLSAVLLDALAESGSRSLTIAPEAGSERMRRAINKCVTEQDIISAAVMAGERRFESLKLYFMLGLPGEEDADIDELLRLVSEVKAAFPRNIVVNVTPFVPKAHTPFEGAPMAPAVLITERLARIRGAMRALHVTVRAESVAEARTQGILARGDLELGRVLLGMRRPAPNGLGRALEQAGLDAESYLRRRDPQERLPWAFVDSGIGAANLRREAERSEDGLESAPCAVGRCARCGVCEPEPQP